MNFFASRHHNFTVLCAACFVERRDELLCQKTGRILVPVSAIYADFRRLVIDHMISNGGDILTGHFPGSVNSVADHFSSLVGLVMQKCGTSLANELLLILSGREEIIQPISSLKIWIYWKL